MQPQALFLSGSFQAVSGSVPIVRHQRIYGSKAVRFRKRMRARQPLCVMCLAKGRITAGKECDHIIPLSEGGTNDPSNIQVLCHDCHLEKHGCDVVVIGVDGWPISER